MWTCHERDGGVLASRLFSLPERILFSTAPLEVCNSRERNSSSSEGAPDCRRLRLARWGSSERAFSRACKSRRAWEPERFLQTTPTRAQCTSNNFPSYARTRLVIFILSGDKLLIPALYVARRRTSDRGISLPVRP
ncbi:hypothetical protein AAFF_G00030670 [Aldrovandia affinis]|uniref:Uncharacterized protein n=1 Tax=Aldrovandia affinis TaxID=143900 RepID=A0AAD7S6B7_9TELE|nr:hypothetical protein AAFF_G00030670 [Aldrovandia affinis]